MDVSFLAKNNKNLYLFYLLDCNMFYHYAGHSALGVKKNNTI